MSAACIFCWSMHRANNTHPPPDCTIALCSSWSIHRVNNTHLPQLHHSLVFVLGGCQVPSGRVQFQLQLLYLIHVPGFHLSLWMFQGILYQKVNREASNTTFKELIEIISILFKITHTAIWAIKYCKCIIFSLYDIWFFIIKIFCYLTWTWYGGD